MYESFFNLAKKPFDLLPNPDFMYLSKSHKQALTYIDYAIHDRTGFILLTGDIGSGKTTIIRDLIRKNEESMVLSKIFNTSVNVEQLLALINEDFGIPVQMSEKSVLLRDLNDFLIDQYAQGKKPVLIIDEAQNLTLETLEEVRMLSNLETDNAKLLQVILVGQPELRDTLSLPGLLQLRQRISINCHLRPLAKEEILPYILHRLEIAGNRNAAIFTPGAVNNIWQHSRGIPRLINIICDFLLLSAFAMETTEITDDLAQEVIGDLDFENRYWREAGPADSDTGADPVEGRTVGWSYSFADEVRELLREILSRIEVLEGKVTQLDLARLGEARDSVATQEVAGAEQMSDTVRELAQVRDHLLALSSSLALRADSDPRAGYGEKRRGFLGKLFNVA